MFMTFCMMLHRVCARLLSLPRSVAFSTTSMSTHVTFLHHCTIQHPFFFSWRNTMHMRARTHTNTPIIQAVDKYYAWGTDIAGRSAVQWAHTFIVSSIFNFMSLGLLASGGFNPAGLKPPVSVFLLASSVSFFALGESMIIFGGFLSFQKSWDAIGKSASGERKKKEKNELKGTTRDFMKVEGQWRREQHRIRSACHLRNTSKGWYIYIINK